jgi:hypothetical protein
VTRFISVKIAENAAQPVFLNKNKTYTFALEISSPILGYLCNLQKGSKVNSHPIGENSSNLVTLLSASVARRSNRGFVDNKTKCSHLST